MSEARQFRMNEPKVIHQLIDGEVVLIHLERGFYFCLDAVGSVVLQEIERQATDSQIVSAVVAKYIGDAAVIEKDVRQLLDELTAEDLIVSLPLAADAVTAAENCSTSASAKTPYLAPKLEKFTDLQELLLLDPIHEVEETGWPHRKA